MQQVLKLGAIWCPPCRLQDSVVGDLMREKALPDVDFFELDIDEEPELAARFPNQSIPYTLLFYEGRRLDVRSERLEVLDGGSWAGYGGSSSRSSARWQPGARDRARSSRHDHTGVEGGAAWSTAPLSPHGAR